MGRYTLIQNFEMGSSNTAVIDFLKKLSFDGYVLAGHSVTNLFEDKEIKGDLDFWVHSGDREKFMSAISEFSTYNVEKLEISPSLIDITINGLPTISIIFALFSPFEMIKNFDLVYCRCFYDGINLIHYNGLNDDFLNCLKTRVILDYENLEEFRIRKAIGYGYKFPKEKWNKYNSYLLNESGKALLSDKFPDINLSHLTPFERYTIFFKQTKNLDVTQTIKEYIGYIDMNFNDKLIVDEKFCEHGNIRPNLKICTLYPNQVDMLHQYIKRVIFINPVISGQYEKLNFVLNEENVKIDKNVEYQVIQLSEKSYLTVEFLPDDLNFNFTDLFYSHPKDRHKIIIHGKEIEVERWQKSYLNTPKISKCIKDGHKSYMYSGKNDAENNGPVPELFRELFNAIKQKDEKYNQLAINWYGETDSIALHSDCEIGMIEDYKIAILSLYYHPVHKILKLRSETQEFNVPLYNRSIVTMCGDTQKEFKHGVEKHLFNDNYRISMTFRQMTSNEVPSNYFES